MKDLSCSRLKAHWRYSAVYLTALLSLLSAWLLLSNQSLKVDSLSMPTLDSTNDLALITALALVVCLGASVGLLLNRIKKLTAAHDVHNHAALHDDLTGAANRRHFELRMDELLKDKTPSHALLMIDLDRFKPVNDLYGHAAGDALLCEITSGFKRLTTHLDLVARLGGDEFAMLLSDKDRAQAEQIALNVLQFVNKFKLTWEGQRLGVGVSIGLVNITRPGLTASRIMAASDEALYAAKESGRGAIFAAELSENPDEPSLFERISADVSPPVSSARSHEPENGHRQELFGLPMACLESARNEDRRRLHGARRRHEVKHWICVDPATHGDKLSPGMQMRELISDAASRNDGGADFARWTMALTIDAASRLSPSLLGRTGFVIPLPARALVVVPGLAEELMRSNALSHQPLRHISFILHGVEQVYGAPELKQAYQRFNDSDVRLGFEIRADNLEVLAPLRHIPFAELHLGRELIKKLRPNTKDNATLDALFAVTSHMGTTLVAPSVDTQEEVRLLTKKGVKRFAGSVVGSAEPLYAILAQLNQNADPGLTT